MDYSRKCQLGYSEECEQEIDLKDLLFHILYRWRSVLLATLIVGILSGGYAVVYNKNILPKKTAEAQAQLEEMFLIQAQELDQGSVQVQGKTAEDVEKEIEQIQTQLEELKKLNPAKRAVVGFAAGFFVMVFCYGISYVLSNRLHEERALRDRYGYFLLGTFPRLCKDKPLSGIDRFLEKKEGVSGQLALEEVYRIVSVNITNLAKDGGVFLVTGTVDIGKLQELVKKILPLLQKNVILMTGADMNLTADTLKALAECDGVILVEERGKSHWAKVQKECENIEVLKKRVVGYVVL